MEKNRFKTPFCVTSALTISVAMLCLNVFADVIVDFPQAFSKQEQNIEISSYQEQPHSFSSQEALCDYTLNAQSWEEVQSIELSKAYSICQLQAQLGKSKTYLLRKDKINHFDNLSKSEKKKLADALFYRLLTHQKLNLTSKELYIVTQEIHQLSRKTKYSLSGLSSFDKLKIGYLPWETKPSHSHANLSVVKLALPSMTDAKIHYREYHLNASSQQHERGLESVGYNLVDKNKLSIVLSIPQLTQGYLKHAYQFLPNENSYGRMPASTQDHFSQEISNLEMEQFLLGKLIKVEKDQWNKRQLTEKLKTIDLKIAKLKSF